MSNRELESFYKKARVVKQTQCPKCEQEGKDKSKDNATHYEDGGIYCFDIKTDVLTYEGVRSIEEILNKPVRILNGNSEWEESVFTQYGKQEIVELTLKRKGKFKTIRTTANHRWFLYDRITHTETKDLKINARLRGNLLPLNQIVPSNDGLIHGLVFGDGTKRKNRNSQYILDIHTKDKLDIISKIISNIKPPTEARPYSKAFINSSVLLKELPDVSLHTDEYLYGFLVGYMATDGNVNETDVRLQSISSVAIAFVKDLAIRFGIMSYPIQTWVRQPGKTFLKDRESILYSLSFITQSLPDNFILRKPEHIVRPTTGPLLTWSVVDIVYTGVEEDVYCCQTSTKSFTLADYILTGNCWARHGCLQMSDTYKKIKNKDRHIEDVDMGNDFSPEYWDTLVTETTPDPRGFRGLLKATCEKYGVMHEIDPETGKVRYQYYPVTKANDLSGVRWRDMDKKFFRRGEVGGDCDLFGQVSFQNTTSRRIIIACGEIDTMSLYQVVSNESLRKGYGEIPVVCTTIGEGGYKQLQKHYKWLDTFDKIIVCPDQDDAGLAYLHTLAKFLPKNKTHVMTLPRGFKDANEMLVANKLPQLVDAFFKAQIYSPSGIVGSDALFHDLYDFDERPRLTLPFFMGYVQEEMLRGGLEFPSIFNIVAPSGIGKSTILNEIVYHWIMNEPYKVGILALESTRKEFSKLLASRHLNKKLALLDPLERQALLESTVDHNRELYYSSDGSPRFYFMEELDGDINRIKVLIEQLISACDCKIIVIDPLQDLFAGLSNEDQEEFLGWLKLIVKRYEIIIVCINHIRKQDGKTDQNKMYMESEIMGSSTIIKSSFFTMLLNRNKYLKNDDPMTNVTKIMISKNRQTGITGPANDLYYDNVTHLLYDFEEYKKNNPEKFPEESSDY